MRVKSDIAVYDVSFSENPYFVCEIAEIFHSYALKLSNLIELYICAEEDLKVEGIEKRNGWIDVDISPV